MVKITTLSRLAITIVFLLSAATANICAQNADTQPGIFDQQYKTLITNIEGNTLAPPILTLNSSDRLIIGFDGLGDERQYLRYSIQHCTADWQPSDLVDSEVFDGFNYADIDDYAFSRATATHYIHYRITLPNDEFRFRISGNYLLRVYPEDDPERTLLQTRFMVSEGTVGITGDITSRTDVDYNDSHQQLSLTVDANRYPIRDMNNDIRLIISQNGRRDNEATITHPTRLQGQRAIYEHQQQLIFPAGNEYRRMETVTMNYPGMGVAEIDYHAPYYHHILATDKPRFARPYSYDQTQHGRFFIREYNSDNSDTEADYSVVHFTLDQLAIPDMDIYLDGDFMSRRLDDSSMMRYDASTGCYEKILLLKQGAYNYQYLALPRNTTGNASPRQLKATTDQTEGNHYQTVNEYLVRVYYRAPSDRYDRLLGYTLIFSGR